jgi:hypothetical protein
MRGIFMTDTTDAPPIPSLCESAQSDGAQAANIRAIQTRMWTGTSALGGFSRGREKPLGSDLGRRLVRR